MATLVSCTNIKFTGHDGTNWYYGTSSNAWKDTSYNTNGGIPCFGHQGNNLRALIIQFTTPTFPSGSTNKKIHFTFPIWRGNTSYTTAYAGTIDFRWRTLATGPSLSSQSATQYLNSTSYLTENIETKEIGKGYTSQTFTINASSLSSNTTYYLAIYANSYIENKTRVGIMSNNFSSANYERLNVQAEYTTSSGGGGTTTYYLTIKYNANGGSGAPSNQKVTGSSSSLSIKLSTVTPTRSGYTFLGWSTSSSATSASYSAGGTYPFTGSTVSSASQTLYAVWKKNTVYTYCCYDLTNKQRIGSEINTSSASITCPSKTGYKYEGYVYHQDYASCISYQQSTGYDSTGTTCSQHKSSLPYVVFFYTKIPTTYTVQCYDYKYNSSGGYLGYQVNSITKNYTDGSTAKGSAWGEDSPWEGYEYGGCSSISVSSTNKTVERYFYPISYEVQYHLNGASGTAPTSTTRRYNETYKLTPTKPERDGYNFKGWNTDSSASTGYTDEDTMSASTSMEITHYYAIWEQIFYYRSYDVTNNKYLDTSPSTSTASSITCPSTPTGYTYTGYKYHTNFENCESQSGYDGTGTSCSTHSSFPYILFCYKQIKYYITVKYHINDGSNNFFATKNYDSTAINVPFNIIEETPTRDKYEFLGWGTYALDTTPNYQSGATNLTYEGSLSSENPAICNLYAVWKKKGNVYYCINNEWLLCETYICENGTWVPCQLSYSPSGTSWKQ